MKRPLMRFAALAFILTLPFAIGIGSAAASAPSSGLASADDASDGGESIPTVPPIVDGEYIYFTAHFSQGWNLFSVPLSGHYPFPPCPEGAFCVQDAQIAPQPTQGPTEASVQVATQMGQPAIAAGKPPTLVSTDCASKAAWHYDPSARQHERVSAENLGPGKGYFFYSPKSCSMTFAGRGYGASDYKQQVFTGWNMIGAPYNPLTRCDNIYRCIGSGSTPLSKIIGSCGFKTAYYYDQQSRSWIKTDKLEKGKGYFVKSEGACMMFQTQPPAPTPPEPPGREDPADPCPAGWDWYRGKCYKTSEGKLLNQAQAQAHCQGSSAHLATINDAHENAWILAKYGSILQDHELWIGYWEPNGDGEWSWINGETSSYANWLTSNPDNPDAERCATMFNESGRWNSAYCAANWRQYALCEKNGALQIA